MGKFKVGDEVKVIRSFRKFDEGEVAKVLEIDIADTRLPILLGNENKQDWVHGDYLELTKPKITKKQRIETLEKEVSELKLIVHELRERKVVEPSTVEDVLQKEFVEVIEFKGAKYRKVDREAKEGDVAILTNGIKPKPWLTIGKPYEVTEYGVAKIFDDEGSRLNLYRNEPTYNRTPETVDVYELITAPSTTTTVEDKQDVQRQTVPCAAAKTPNQLRAEIIEKAKVFFDENGGSEFTFSPVANERARFCWKVVSNGYGFDTLHGLSSCHPNDVFNEHIGKAIALGRALKLDVSEFEQAVQPNEAVIGMKFIDRHDDTREVVNDEKFCTRESMKSHIDSDNVQKYPIKIINDTNAIYGGVE